MRELYEAIAQNLKNRRNSLDITQAELAERAGISAGYVAEIEIARKRPSLDTIALLAAALQIRPYRLLMSEKDIASVAETAGLDQGYAVVARLRQKLDEELRGLLDEGNRGSASDRKKQT
ncbi:MAG: helix-turn-helix transcriptional regulator [Spirochaetota bacterium]